MHAMEKIAIQGIAGAFHDEAGQLLVPGAEPVACATFQDVFDAVASGVAEYGVVAVENSIHGSINPVYRLLERRPVHVSGEVTLNIEQYLIGCEPVELSLLNAPEAEICTMFPAFAQCELWLQDHLPQAKRTEMYDTAYSLVSVLEAGDPLRVAIAGRRAMDVYGGHIIAGPINDHVHNYTRFMLLTKEKLSVGDANRTLIILTTDHTDGALYEALGAFAEGAINLSKLDSHPIPSDQRHYSFYIDLEAGEQETRTQQAFARLGELGCTVKVLGSYKV